MSRAHRTNGRWVRPVAVGAACTLLAIGVSACSDEAATCESTLECSPTQACVDSSCQRLSCQTSLECPADAICFSSTGVCGARQCRTDPDCAQDRRNPFCVGGECIADAPPECDEREDCGAGQVCVEQSCEAVEPSGTCDTDEDCGNPQVCDPEQGEAGACVDACQDDDACAGDTPRACDIASGLCLSVECLDAEDCGLDEICLEEHTCDVERFPCDTLTCDDPERPFMTEPIDDMCRCVQCLAQNNCSQALVEVCTPSNRCLYCETPGAGPADCPLDLPLFREGCCVECDVDAECESLGLGSICLRGQCVPCDCNAGCECPGESECDNQDDGSGVCVTPPGQVGDACTSQDQCEDFLACSYLSGECVTQTSGGSCATGCPSPSRCANTTGGGFCMGCHPDQQECPEGFVCDVREEWDGVFDGGQCLPSS